MKENRKVIVLKTDIQSPEMVAEIGPVFDNHVAITQWSIDLEDIDKVLRIEAHSFLSQKDVQELMYLNGRKTEELED